MPKLISQRPKGRRTVPPCGRLIEYVPPTSPFQKLIDSERQKQRLTGRELAGKIVVNGKPLSQSTLWIWLHNTNGYPHPRSFKPAHLDQLSKALRVPKAKIEQALDASRHLYTDRENPMPQAAFDSFARFIEILEHDRRQNVSKSYVLNLAKNLYGGAAASRVANGAPDQSNFPRSHALASRASRSGRSVRRHARRKSTRK